MIKLMSQYEPKELIYGVVRYIRDNGYPRMASDLFISNGEKNKRSMFLVSRADKCKSELLRRYGDVEKWTDLGMNGVRGTAKRLGLTIMFIDGHFYELQY